MTHRVLPAAEYDRLADTYIAPVVPGLGAETQIVVVEDGDVVVAHWALMTLPHVECAWIHPLYRKHPAVVRHLLVGMRQTARDAGVIRVMTAAIDDEARQLLRHLGATKLEGDHYVLPFKEA
jgi:hypothetical protein